MIASISSFHFCCGLASFFALPRASLIGLASLASLTSSLELLATSFCDFLKVTGLRVPFLMSRCSSCHLLHELPQLGLLVVGAAEAGAGDRDENPGIKAKTIHLRIMLRISRCLGDIEGRRKSVGRLKWQAGPIRWGPVRKAELRFRIIAIVV